MTTHPAGAPRPEQSGVYRVPRALATLRAAARHAHFAWFDVDLSAVRDKAGLLKACARDLKFPPHFGANWDAFSDCVNDFAWAAAPGYVIQFGHVAATARHAPDEMATAVEILRTAADAWRKRGKAFIVLLDSAPPALGMDEFAGPPPG